MGCIILIVDHSTITNKESKGGFDVLIRNEREKLVCIKLCM